MIKYLLFVGVLWATTASIVRADCSGASIEDLRKAYAEGQTHEAAGRSAAAVRAYARALEFTCAKENPVSPEAAKRAAPLALKLGRDEERAGNMVSRSLERPGAFEWYELGGHYQDADRVLMAAVRADVEEVALYDHARQHFSYRRLAAFQSNNRYRIAATGGYNLKAEVIGELDVIPAANVDKILQHEDKTFSDQYAKDYVSLMQSRPDNVMDFAGQQRAQQAQQRFMAKWRSDPLEASQALLEQAREWTSRIPEEAARNSAQAKWQQRAVQRGNRLLEHYHGAPELIERAVDYYRRADADQAIAKAYEQARKLGDQASAGGRHALASSYYRIAGDDDKADQADERASADAERQMAPTIEQQRRQAEQMREMYNNPGQIEALRRQAEEMQRRMLKDAGQRQQFQEGQQELEQELGL